MKTRLSDVAIWFDPAETIYKLAGQRLRLIAPDGTHRDTLVVVTHSVFSEGLPPRFSVKIVNGGVYYLTSEAIKMIRPHDGSDEQVDLILSFAD